MRRLGPALLAIALVTMPASLAADEAVPGRAELIALIRDYRAALESVLGFDEAAVERAARETEKRRELLARAIVSRRELQESERVLAAAEAKLAETRWRIREAEYTLSEALAAEARPADRPLPAPERPDPTPVLVRNAGPGRWSLAETPKLQSFFAGRFGRLLPVSALGQTPLHDRLGFDHHDALDVAVPPDSPEGAALIQYLRAAEIPFMTFRGAVPGEATGAHIHVGAASPRF